MRRNLKHGRSLPSSSSSSSSATAYTTTELGGGGCTAGGVHVASSQVDGHNRWVRLQTSGRSPSPRSGHDVVVINNKAYLFGGCGGEHDQIVCLNDVYVFDLELHRWDRVSAKGDVPLARASFGMCAGPTPNTVIVAGGTGVEMDSLRADVVQFDTRSRTWNKVLTDSEATPCKFYGQSVCAYEDNLLLFGGSTGLHYSNDLYEYNVRNNSWRKMITTGKKPSPRYKHQAVVVGHIMYVLGGGCFKPEQSEIDLYQLDLQTCTWEKPDMNGQTPKARVAHSCSYDAVSKTIYLWGGFTSELSRLQDFYALHCPTLTWTCMNSAAADVNVPAPIMGAGLTPPPPPVMDDPVIPPARAFHSAVFHKGALYVFSGANGDVRYSDVWRYKVRSSPPTLSMLASRVLRKEGVGVSPGVISGVKRQARSSAHFLNKDLAQILPLELLQGVMLMNEYADRLC